MPIVYEDADEYLIIARPAQQVELDSVGAIVGPGEVALVVPKNMFMQRRRQMFQRQRRPSFDTTAQPAQPNQTLGRGAGRRGDPRR